MKKFLTVVMSVALAASLFACGSGGDGTKKDGENKDAKTTTEAAAGDKSGSGEVKDTTPFSFQDQKTGAAPAVDGLKTKNKDGKAIRIGFSISANDQYGATMSAAMMDKAKELGIDVKMAESKENDTQMINQVKQFAADGVDAVIVQPTNSKIPQKVIDAAGKIPVIFLNRIPEGQLKGAAYYVGSDDYVAGSLQGESLAKWAKANNKTEINLVQFMGEMGVSNTEFRTKGVKDVLDKAGIKVNYVFKDTAQWKRDIANSKMQTFLGTGKAFDAVAANNDEMALGAIIAMKNKGIDFGKVPVLGVDATDAGVAAVKTGEMFATVFQDPKGQGEGALAEVLAVLDGKNPPRRVDIPFVLVTKDNLTTYKK